MDNIPVQSPPSQINLAPVSETTPQPEKSSYHPHIIGFVTLIIIFGLGYFFGTRKVNYSEPIPSPQAIASPVPSPDSTANWNTYKFSGFSLSFKYPDTLKLDELDIKDRPTYYKDSPYVMLVDNNASMTITPNGVEGFGFESSDYETVGKRVEVNGSNVEIAGNQIFKTRILYKPTGSISYFISMKNPDNDSQFVSISYKATSGDVSQYSQQIFDHILSTFKFTE